MMIRYVKGSIWFVLIGLLTLPSYLSAASITEKSTALGEGCIASEYNSTAMGQGTKARGKVSTTMGLGTIADGDYSTALGLYTTANGTYSIAAGYFTTAEASLSTIIGKGVGAWAKLINNTPNSFMVGYMSNEADTVPEFFVEDRGVGIGTTDPGYALEVNGSAGKPGGGSWEDSSDERLKKDIAALGSREALEKIIQLRGVTFFWTNPEEHAEGQHAGVLAQEVEAVFPDWVGDVEPKGKDKSLVPQGEKVKSIFFPHDFNAYLIEAIKELKAQNEELRSEIEELRLMIKELKS